MGNVIRHVADGARNGGSYSEGVNDEENDYVIGVCSDIRENDKYSKGAEPSTNNNPQHDHDISEHSINEEVLVLISNNIEQTNYIAIDVISGSRGRFSKNDQKKADVFRRFKHVSDFPSNTTIIYLVATNDINNSPITTRDVMISIDMLGPSKFVA